MFIIFFKCETIKTSGYHRSTWTIDETSEGAAHRQTKFLKAEDICQLQVVVGQHGELPVSVLCAMRIGCDVLTYAPLEP
jgi:hypothetical protein